MKNTFPVIVSLGILVLLIVFAGGFLIGSAIEKQKTPISSDLSQAIKSKTIMVSSLVAGGEITDISNRTLTLASKGESLEVIIKDGAPVNSFASSQGTGTPTKSAKIGFASLKKGDNVYVNLEVLENGKFQGTSVTVVPKQ